MNYLQIDKASINNGPGVRVVLWVSGCTLYCKGCQNQESWNFNAGKLFDEKVKKELFKALDKPYIQGITFSGGHPLEDENVNDIFNLVTDIKDNFPDKDIWLYTGYTFGHILNDPSESINTMLRRKIISMCDVVVDGQYIEQQRDITLKFRGSKNQRLVDVKESIKQNKIITIQN